VLNFDLILAAVDGKLSSVEVQRHLDQGKRLLSAGQLNDALTHYHAAVGKETHLLF